MTGLRRPIGQLLEGNVRTGLRLLTCRTRAFGCPEGATAWLGPGLREMVCGDKGRPPYANQHGPVDPSSQSAGTLGRVDLSD